MCGRSQQQFTVMSGVTGLSKGGRGSDRTGPADGTGLSGARSPSGASSRFRGAGPFGGLFAESGTGGEPSASPDHPMAGPATRIGDDARREVDAVLALAMSLGYLTFPEWEARSAQVLEATTTAALAAVTADLPVAELRRRDPVQVAERTAAARRGIRAHTAGWLALAVLMIAIWLAVAIPTGAWYPWPIWPILGTGIGLASHVVPARAALRSS